MSEKIDITVFTSDQESADIFINLIKALECLSSNDLIGLEIMAVALQIPPIRNHVVDLINNTNILVKRELKKAEKEMILKKVYKKVNDNSCKNFDKKLH